MVAAAVRTMRDKSLGGALIVAGFQAIVPSAFAGALAAGAVAIGIASLCPPGSKGGFETPNWIVPLSLLAVSVCAATAAMQTVPRRKAQIKDRFFWLGTTAWTIAGTLFGGVAGVGEGFDGYFVRQSNAGPIGPAIAGAVIGFVGVLLWRLAVVGACQDIPPTTTVS
jgi:hypothetical protein